MTELDNALFCEAYNRMNKESKMKREKECAYITLVNMRNMLVEHARENTEIPIPMRGQRLSKKIESRYGIEYDSEFIMIWVVLERLCNGEYELKKKNHDL